MPEFPPRYAPLADFIAPALGRSQLWRTIGGLVLASVLYFLALQVILAGLLAGAVLWGRGLTLQAIAEGSTPAGLMVLLYSYVPLTFGIALATSLMRKRSAMGLIGPPGPALRCCLWVAVPLMAVSVGLIPLSLMSDDVARNVSFLHQLPWLPVAVVGLFIQTGTEELVFRGFLQQQLAARWASPWVWMLLPSLIFGVLHYAPVEYGASAPFVVGWAVLFGLAAADLTARTGNLGAAVGLHFANNAASMLLVGVAGRLDALALFTARVDLSALWAQLPYLAIDTLSLLVSWLLARLILRV